MSNRILCFALRGLFEVDRLHLQQREVALAFLGRADLSFDGIACAQAEAPDLRRRDVDVVRTREVVLVRSAQEAEAVLQDLEHALGEDLAAVLGLGLQDREDQVLLAQPRRVLDVHRLGELGQLRHRLLLQLPDENRLRRVVGLVLEIGFFFGELGVTRQVVAFRRVETTAAIAAVSTAATTAATGSSSTTATATARTARAPPATSSVSIALLGAGSVFVVAGLRQSLTAHEDLSLGLVDR